MVRVCVLATLLAAGIASAQSQPQHGGGHHHSAGSGSGSSGTGSGSSASAPSDSAATTTAATAAPDPNAHPEGDYGGVVPGQAQRPDAHGRPRKPLPKGTLSWIGFESKDGTTELFFQSAAPFDVVQHVEDGALVVDLAGVTKLGANTWRPVDTRFFDGPVARVAAHTVGASKGKNPHAAGIEVRVSFKDPKAVAQGSFRSATENDGLFYAYLTWVSAATATPTIQEPEK
jgi:hypothetical protein